MLKRPVFYGVLQLWLQYTRERKKVNRHEFSNRSYKTNKTYLHKIPLRPVRRDFGGSLNFIFR